MMSFNFKKWNTILGWLAFSIALVTYSLTVEPTLSFWDCGEYIATSANLEVGHPPGAPLFQMLGAFFAMFAFTPDKIALMVNMLSVFSSAFTILFMFWSLTMVMKKVLLKENETNENAIMVLGSSFIAAVAFSFTDSFWFNAVEAEVYAMATFFIALLFWLGLRWEQDLDNPKGNKWLLIISLVIGLSFGVHFMALLTIPAIGFLYFFKKYQTITVKNFVLANIIIVAVLLFIFKLLLPFAMAFFGKSEIFMVNSLGLPFNSGTIFSLLLIIGLFYFGLKRTKQKGQVFYNTIILSVLFILIGFSTWLMLPIRANANPPINENKPSDAAEVLAYYNREQYGEQHLFYGPQFSETYSGLDEETPYLDGKPNYERDDKEQKYVITNNYKNAVQNSDDQHKSFLPRMWSTEHAENYMRFTEPLDFRIDNNAFRDDETGEIDNEQMSQMLDVVSQFKAAYSSGRLDEEDYVKFLDGYGRYLIVDKPTFANNMRYMFQFQFGYMYWRYLMWNFVGKQNDVQGKYDDFNGNWLSGIKFIDEARLGSQDNLTTDVLNNKGRNTYYFIPFLLALIGLIFHAKRDLKSFYVLLALFLFTGLALKIYLNERPFEVRERDYALIGSFYVFAMWIGFGIYSIYEGVKKYLNPKITVPIVLGVTFFAAPVLLASENWDDHSRANKYTALANAKSYLSSCDKNAILFTIGDNDTFPLWYAQEVEGFRTDVRIVNTSLLMTDWYIDQMKQKAYESDPVPISLDINLYRGSKRDFSYFVDKSTDTIPLDNFIRFLCLEDDRAKLEFPSGQSVNYYPSNNIVINVDKASVIKNKVVSEKYYDSIVPQINLKIKGNALYKNRLIMLDIINNNNWKRPIYFTGGSFGDDDYIWMKDYLQLDGMCFKLVPIKTNSSKEGPNPLEMGYIDNDKMYDIIMSWDWGNSGNDNMYHDPETRKNAITYRTNMARLMESLINEGKTEKAEKIINLSLEKMPVEKFGYYVLVEPFVQGYYNLGKKEKARAILSKLIVKYQEELNFYKGMSDVAKEDNYVEIVTNIERYRGLLEIMKIEEDLEFYNKEKLKFNNYNKLFPRFKREME